MKSRRKGKKKSRVRPVFSSIRKPLAPPGHPITRAKPEEIARPARRKVKHKRSPAALEALEEET